MGKAASLVERLEQLRTQAERESQSAHRLYIMWYALFVVLGGGTLFLSAVIASTALTESLDRIVLGWLGAAAAISSGILTFLNVQSQRDKNERASAAWNDNKESAATALASYSSDPAATSPEYRDLLRFTDAIRKHQTDVRNAIFVPAPTSSDMSSGTADRQGETTGHA